MYWPTSNRTQNLGWPRMTCIALLLGIIATPWAQSADAPVAEKPADSPDRAVYLARVPLPLVGNSDTQFMARVDKLLASLPDDNKRPTLVFEFRQPKSTTGATNQFERALTLARYLTSRRFRRVRTVAYLPSSVEGHAVLPVLACEEIMIAPGAAFGAAGLDEPEIDATMRSAYTEIAGRTGTVPIPVVLGMLDPAVAVTEVQLVGGGVRYATSADLVTLRKEAKIWKERTIIRAGELGKFSGRQLRLELGFASHLTADRKQLANALGVAAESIVDMSATAANWVPIRIDLKGRITSRTADDLIRAIDQGIRKKNVNLIFVSIDSPGGVAEPAIRLMNELTRYDPTKVHTVSFVAARALSVAAPLALLCDETYVAPAAKLGGPGDAFLDRATLDDMSESLRAMAKAKGRGWSLLVAMVDPKLEVNRYRREGTGEIRYFCERERSEQEDPAVWKRDALVETAEGITGPEAKRLRLARDVVDNLQAVAARYGIDTPLETPRPNTMIRAIERLAMQPWLARTLLFIAFFALITEASAPGLGVAGFVSGICFLLFFWCQFLSGTAGWLELLLFGGGLICLALELFVIPGFGIFGVGGIIMILTSIVLASQTFIIPRNTYQIDQLPNSLASILTACGGVVAAMWILRRILPEAPLLRRLMLTPPDAEETDIVEKLVDRGHLEGKPGVTLTQLTPSGKAQFGDEVVDVISDATLVARGTRVLAVEVRGNHVLVEPLDEG